MKHASGCVVLLARWRAEKRGPSSQFLPQHASSGPAIFIPGTTLKHCSLLLKPELLKVSTGDYCSAIYLHGTGSDVQRLPLERHASLTRLVEKPIAC